MQHVEANSKFDKKKKESAVYSSRSMWLINLNPMQQVQLLLKEC